MKQFSLIVLCVLIALVLVWFVMESKDTNPSGDALQGTTIKSDSTFNSVAQNLKQDSILESKKSYWLDVNPDFQSVELFHLSENLIEDFNGDRVKDMVKFEEGAIHFIDGATKQLTKLGKGGANLYDDFQSANYWGILRDKAIYETIFDEDGEPNDMQETFLAHPSILISWFESGGGIIVFNDGKFRWVHQGS